MNLSVDKDLLGRPSDTVDILEINAWGVLPSLPVSLQSSFKSEDLGDHKIRSTIVTDSLIIHEIDNKLRETGLPNNEVHADVVLTPGVPEKADAAEEVKKGKHFQVDEEINNKIAFWCGNIEQVLTEGCICSCNEMLREAQPSQTTQLLKHSSAELQKQVFNTYRCVTGDVVVLRPTVLPIRHVILTAGPKYNERYKNAAENTLFNCYRNSFDTALDKKIETLTISKLHNNYKGYPPKAAIHIALRTTRRYLELHKDSFRKICFVLNNISHLVHYQELFPYYFPRNSADYKFQLELPDDIGGAYGEPQHHGSANNYIKAHWSTSSESLAKKLNVSSSTFSSMRQDPDSARLFEQSQQPDVYNQLLQWSRTEDLSRIAKCRAMYHSGFDYVGSPVVVCVGRHFPTHLPEHKVLSHCVQVMDPLTIRPYVMVYFHTACTGPRADIDLLQKVFANSPPRYKTNIKALYNLHATKYQKFQTWWFTVSKAKEVKGKVVHLSSLKLLFGKISPDQLQIPQFILDFDYKQNGDLK